MSESSSLYINMGHHKLHITTGGALLRLTLGLECSLMIGLGPLLHEVLIDSWFSPKLNFG